MFLVSEDKKKKIVVFWNSNSNLSLHCHEFFVSRKVFLQNGSSHITTQQEKKTRSRAISFSIHSHFHLVIPIKILLLYYISLSCSEYHEFGYTTLRIMHRVCLFSCHLLQLWRLKSTVQC